MQPLKPEERARIISLYPEAEKDLEEYETLLAGIFGSDPSLSSDSEKNDLRLQELSAKLFPPTEVK